MAGILTGEQNRGLVIARRSVRYLAQFLKGVFHVNDTGSDPDHRRKWQTGVTAGPSDFQVLFNGVVII